MIRQVVAEALIREVRDPRISLVTVTRVEVSQDLSHARLFVTMHAEGEEREATLEGLKRASGFFRTRVSKVLSTRITPDLLFEADLGAEHAARIEQILGALKRGEEAP